jgi:hypothetical protein
MSPTICQLIYPAMNCLVFCKNCAAGIYSKKCVVESARFELACRMAAAIGLANRVNNPL